jgi:hypothetical protein
VKELQNFEQFELGDDDGGWGIPEDDPHRKAWIESDNKVSVSYPTSHQGWLKGEGSVESQSKFVPTSRSWRRSAPPVGCLCL